MSTAASMASHVLRRARQGLSEPLAMLCGGRLPASAPASDAPSCSYATGSPSFRDSRGGSDMRRRQQGGALQAGAAAAVSGEAPSVDVALGNVPRKVLQLIGDPRTGVADDTTTAPFGDMSVDMIWHQPSNEVMWFKYAWAGSMVKDSHRDGRLSEQSKNLMYLLRAKDPARWTPIALARKFRVRTQRVLAILALKELEAQAIESGRLLQGPLQPYALRVALSDIALDPATGEPLEGGAAARNSECAAGAAPSTATVQQRVLVTAQRSHLRLLRLLQGHGFSLAALAAAAAADLAAAEEYAKQHLPKSGDDAAPGGAASTASYAAGIKQQVESCLAALKPFFSSSLIARQAEVHAIKAKLRHLVAAGLPATDSAAADSADAAQPAAQHNADPNGAVASEPAPTGSSGGNELQVLIAASKPAAFVDAFLSLDQREQDVLRAVPAVGAALNVHGPKGQAPNNALNGSAAASLFDIFDGEHLAASDIARVVHAASALDAATRQLQAASPAGAANAGADSNLAAQQLQSLHRLASVYHHLDHAYNEASPEAASITESNLGAQAKMLEVLAEVDPQAERKVRAYDLLMKKEALGAGDVKTFREGLRRLFGKQDAEVQTGGESNVVDEEGGDGGGSKRDKGRPMETNHDLLAAYIDTQVVGRVYHRGSGERHAVRLPSFPSFEGYSLQEFDRVQEGELSALNRLVAEREDAMLADEFHDKLLYNSGLAGDDLWDTSYRAKPQKPADGWRYVVHDLSGGANEAIVVQPDGSSRGLTDSERYYKDRRTPKPRRRLHFFEDHRK